MKVNTIMRKAVKSCHPDTDLAAAAMLMWEGDCGVIPVVDADNKLVGVVTDRDICMAVATKHRVASAIRIQELLERQVFAVRRDVDVGKALQLMQEKQVRRLPVTDAKGHLLGIISINDIMLAATDRKQRDSISLKEAVKTIQSICVHRGAEPAPVRRKPKIVAVS